MKSQGLFNHFFIGLLFIALMGCNSGNENTSESAEEETDQVEIKEKVVEEVVGYPIPSSFELTSMLNEAGAPFIVGLVNPVDQVDNYFNTKDKAVNLGIYGADLSYASTYQHKQETMEFLDVSKRLIDELEISSAFNKSFAERVENNIDNQDSVIDIISNSFYSTYKYLRENEQDISSFLVVSGSWIEGVYITSQIVIVSDNKEPIVDILVKQQKSLSQLMGVLEPVKDNSDISDIYSGLSEINEAYAAIEGEPSDEQIEYLSQLIATLRNSLV